MVHLRKTRPHSFIPKIESSKTKGAVRANKVFRTILFSRCRAAQKLNLSSSPHRRKRHNSEDAEPSGFCGVIQRSPPPVPPALLRRIGVKEITGVGKVRRSLARFYSFLVRLQFLTHKFPATRERLIYNSDLNLGESIFCCSGIWNHGSRDSFLM